MHHNWYQCMVGRRIIKMSAFDVTVTEENAYIRDSSREVFLRMCVETWSFSDFRMLKYILLYIKWQTKSLVPVHGPAVKLYVTLQLRAIGVHALFDQSVTSTALGLNGSLGEVTEEINLPWSFGHWSASLPGSRGPVYPLCGSDTSNFNNLIFLKTWFEDKQFTRKRITFVDILYIQQHYDIVAHLRPCSMLLYNCNSCHYNGRYIKSEQLIRIPISISLVYLLILRID